MGRTRLLVGSCVVYATLHLAVFDTAERRWPSQSSLSLE